MTPDLAPAPRPVAAPPTPALEPPGRWRALVWLALAALLGMSTWFSGTAVVGTLRQTWHLSPGAAAWLTIAVQIGFVAGSLLSAAANLLDLLPPRRVLIASCVAAALVNAGFALVRTPAHAFALRFVAGACLAGVYPTALKLMATWFRRDRGTALGVMVGALAVGSASPHLATAIGGLDWRAAVFSSSLTTALGALIAWRWVHEGPFPFPRARFDPSQAGQVLREPALRLACFGYFGHMWELYAMWGWFGVYLADRFTRAGIAVQPWAPLGAFAAIAAGMAGSWWLGALADRWGRTRAAALAMAVSSVCAVAAGFAFGAPPWVAVALGLVWGASALADSAQFSAMVTELSDPAYVGTALTVQLAIGFSLTTATLWLIPLLRDAWSWHWAFAILAPGPLIGILAMARLARRPEAVRLAGGRG